jgi:hypothetical protein
MSLEMAEGSPAVRQEPDTLVLTDGTSCRHQIKDDAGATHSTSRAGDEPQSSAACAGI